MDKEIKQSHSATITEQKNSHTVSVMTFLTAMSLFFLSYYKTYAQSYFLFAWMFLSAVFAVLLAVNLVTKYAGKYFLRTGVTVLIAYFAGMFSHKLLVKLEVVDIDIIVTLTMLAFVLWGFVISILFLFRKKWLIYTINILNGLLLLAPIVLVIVGAKQKDTFLIALGVITVVPTGLLFVYACNRFNTKVDEVLTAYTLASVIELVILIIIGFTLLSEDGSFLEIFECLTPIDTPVGQERKQAKDAAGIQ